jgi:hypothetical protein
MPISSEAVSAYLPLMEGIQNQFDMMPDELPPSAIARIKGALRNYVATLKTIQAALEQREAKPGDEKDVNWIVTCLIALVEDKWVSDQMKGTEVAVPDASLLQKLDLGHPTDPITYDKIIDLLVAGLRAMLA